MDWTKQQYNKQYENWMPWVEDKYLQWFTKDNKASYTTKDTLDKSKVTGLEPVDKAQDSVNGLVSGQVGQGGLLQPVGDAASNEGFNRAERGGKDDQGSYMGSAASKASEYGGSAAGKVGGMFSTGSKDEKSNGGEKSN